MGTNGSYSPASARAMPRLYAAALSSLLCAYSPAADHSGLDENCGCIRPQTPLSLDDAQRLVHGYVEPYNNVRLKGAIRYTTPKDMLVGPQAQIHAERDRKLEEARL